MGSRVPGPCTVLYSTAHAARGGSISRVEGTHEYESSPHLSEDLIVGNNSILDKDLCTRHIVTIACRFFVPL